MKIPRIEYIKNPTLQKVQAISEPHKITVYLWTGTVIPSATIDDYEAIEACNKLYQRGSNQDPDKLVLDLEEDGHRTVLDVKLTEIRMIEVQYNRPYDIPS